MSWRYQGQMWIKLKVHEIVRTLMTPFVWIGSSHSTTTELELSGLALTRSGVLPGAEAHNDKHDITRRQCSTSIIDIDFVCRVNFGFHVNIITKRYQWGETEIVIRWRYTEKSHVVLAVCCEAQTVLFNKPLQAYHFIRFQSVILENSETWREWVSLVPKNYKFI